MPYLSGVSVDPHPPAQRVVCSSPIRAGYRLSLKKTGAFSFENTPVFIQTRIKLFRYLEDTYSNHTDFNVYIIISLIDQNQLPMLAFQDYQIFFLHPSSTIEALVRTQLFHH